MKDIQINIYKEVKGSHPYLEIKVNGDRIKLNDVNMNIDQFGNIFHEINAGI